MEIPLLTGIYRCMKTSALLHRPFYPLPPVSDKDIAVVSHFIVRVRKGKRKLFRVRLIRRYRYAAASRKNRRRRIRCRRRRKRARGSKPETERSAARRARQKNIQPF